MLTFVRTGAEEKCSVALGRSLQAWEAVSVKVQKFKERLESEANKLADLIETLNETTKRIRYMSLAATASLFIVGIPVAVLATVPPVAACIISVTAVVSFGVVFEYLRGQTRKRLTKEKEEKQRRILQAEKD